MKTNLIIIIVTIIVIIITYIVSPYKLLKNNALNEKLYIYKLSSSQTLKITTDILNGKDISITTEEGYMPFSNSTLANDSTSDFILSQLPLMLEEERNEVIEKINKSYDLAIKDINTIIKN